MKRLLSLAVILVLLVATVSFVRSIGLDGDQNRTKDEVPSFGALLIPEPHESTGPGGESPPSPPQTSESSKDILLVNGENPLPEDYRPESLVTLYDQKNRHFQLANTDIEVCEAVFEAMDTMFTAAQHDGVDGFIITSGYRSFEKQVEVFATSPEGIAAQPGTSEHETGLAFDVTAYGNSNFELTPQFEWLSAHCAEYGFIIRYPKDKEDRTGIPFEPWHYRYVGTPYAKEMMDAGITLEEYLELQV